MRDLGHEKNSQHAFIKGVILHVHFCQQRGELDQHVRSVCVLAVIYQHDIQLFRETLSEKSKKLHKPIPKGILGYGQ